MIKKADIVLFLVILITGLAVSVISLGDSAEGDNVVVTVDNEVYGIYSLAEDRVIEVHQQGHTNNITIKDGVVSMTYSDCANQVCVNTRPIANTSDSIVCLPNRVIVEITSDEGGEVDVITG